MSEETQIEEMAKIFCGMKNGCDGCMWDKVHCNERNYAEEIYNAGYRKQIEAEWVPCDVLPADEDGEWTSYACSMCKHTTDSYYRDVHDLSRYCPNCGAKMKGGAE